MGKRCNKIKDCLYSFSTKFLTVSDNFSSHISDFISLSLRAWIAGVFWHSGILKFENWDTTILLFAEEHPVPMFLFFGPPLPAEFAAYMGTTIELAMPVFLLIGLGSRLATLPLLLMTAVIQFTYLNSVDHVIWAAVLGIILFQGPGRFSWDFFIRRITLQDRDDVHFLWLLVSIAVVMVLTVVSAHEIFALTSGEMKPWLEQWDSFWKPKQV